MIIKCRSVVYRTRRFAWATALTSLGLVAPVGAVETPAPPTVEQALSLKPIQEDVDYDVPTAEDQQGCRVVSAQELGQRGWVVQDAGGRLLRRFVDTNGDNRLDRWCYYKDGVEVYRDIDSDFDEKADEYRWLGTAGIRWGLDANEDGKIDRWKLISAEEVSAEVVAAVRERDWRRFSIVLVGAEDIESLGLDGEKREELEARVAASREAFNAFLASQDIVRPTSRWSYFGGSRPSLLPAGSDGASRDVVFYENVIAVVEDGEDHRQLAIGTLVQVDGGWRAVDAPSALVTGQAVNQGSIFMQASLARPVDETLAAEGVSQELQALLLKLGEAEAAVEDAKSAAARKTATDNYVGVLLDLYRAAGPGEEKISWIRQAADYIFLASQRGDYADGLAELRRVADRLESEKGPLDGIAYLRYRAIEGAFLNAPADTAQAYEQRQKDWVQALETFATEYAESEVAATAIRELALIDEFNLETDKAVERDGKIVADYPQSGEADKARGAVWRLTSTGNRMSLQGTTLDGQSFDLTTYGRNKAVIVHCWATWCNLCTDEFPALRNLRAKYKADQLAIVGINLDIEDADARTFLSRNPLPWPQVHEAGGLDGPIGNQLGLISLPVTFLIGADGKVIKQITSMPELADELDKLLK